jgi:hypothetical protein
MTLNPQQVHLMRLGLPRVPANGSGGGTTTTKSDPWEGQQPYLNQVFSSANNTFQNQYGNPSASVAGFTPMQQQAMGAVQGVANGTNFGNSAAVNNAAGGYTTNLLNGAYLNSNPGNSAFSKFANGSMMSNPYETGALNAANDAITRSYQTATAPQTASAMEASGRFGSGAYQNAVSQNQQDLATQLGNTDAALTNSMYQQNMGNMLAGAQGLSGNYNTASQQQLAGAANAPNIVNSTNAAATNLYNMGGNQQALNQNLINAPWTQLGNFSNLVQGNYGGTTSTPYYQNQTAGALGGAASGAAMGSTFGPWGTAIGAVGGGLVGAFSDRRLKIDIEPTGEHLEGGLPVYRYRYLWDAPSVRRVGVMADEARLVAPHAVSRDASGFDMVNYDMLRGQE